MSQLEINSRESQGVTILDLRGRIVLGEEATGLRECIHKLLADNCKKILLNLQDVTRVDSTGIGILVESVVVTAREGGRLKLVNIPRLLHSTLVVHHLLQAFEIFDDEAKALASFQ